MVFCTSEWALITEYSYGKFNAIHNDNGLLIYLVFEKMSQKYVNEVLTQRIAYQS